MTNTLVNSTQTWVFPSRIHCNVPLTTSRTKQLTNSCPKRTLLWWTIWNTSWEEAGLNPRNSSSKTTGKSSNSTSKATIPTSYIITWLTTLLTSGKSTSPITAETLSPKCLKGNFHNFRQKMPKKFSLNQPG